MSKTEEIVKALEEGKTVKEIKEAGLGSQALIYRVKAKYDAKKNIAESTVPDETEDPEPTDDEIDEIINKICIKPDEKYLTKDKQEKEEEDYRCMGCNHRWKASEMPLSCPNCGAEF